MARWEIETALRKIREAIAEFYLDIDQTYKASCWGREEINGLRQQERKLLAMVADA
jgi:hypothetical protein